MCDSDASIKFIQTFCNILFKQTDIFLNIPLVSGHSNRNGF
jgi:hypothetical protein